MMMAVARSAMLNLRMMMMTDYTPTPDEQRVIEWLLEQRGIAFCRSIDLPWWRFGLRRANEIAAAACGNLARRIGNGEHRP
jgi:hypothetical protein